MPTPPPEDDAPDWGGVAVFTQTQIDVLIKDDTLNTAWRHLPDGVYIGELGQTVQDDGSIAYQCAHPALHWDTIEQLLEVVDNRALAALVKAEHAKGGDWRTPARIQVREAVERKPGAERTAQRDNNRANAQNAREGKLKTAPTRERPLGKVNGAKRP